jgi:hypothetical protein
MMKSPTDDELLTRAYELLRGWESGVAFRLHCYLRAGDIVAFDVVRLLARAFALGYRAGEQERDYHGN